MRKKSGRLLAVVAGQSCGVACASPSPTTPLRPPPADSAVLGVGVPDCGTTSCGPHVSTIPVELGLSQVTQLRSSGRHRCARAAGGGRRVACGAGDRGFSAKSGCPPVTSIHRVLFSRSMQGSMFEAGARVASTQRSQVLRNCSPARSPKPVSVQSTVKFPSDPNRVSHVRRAWETVLYFVQGCPSWLTIP